MNANLPTDSMRNRSEFTLGRILLDQGKLTAQDAERILRVQKEQNLRFGAAAIQLGLITEKDMQRALAQQFDYPYLPVGEGGFSKELIAAYEPFSAQVEALRGLRSQLMLRWFADGKKTLALTGAKAEDGTAGLTANLGIVFSQLGERTLIIDANLRSPSLHTYFNLSGNQGLSDILAERADLGAISRIPNFVDLSLMSAGTQPPNPAELLSREKMGELLATLAGQYDVILINTPPASEAADFQSVAARTGGAMIAMRKHRTRLQEIAGIKDMLATAGVAIVGAVINDV